MPRLVHITTVPQTATAFLKGQLRWLRDRHFDVTVISSPGPLLEQFARDESIAVRSLPMQRSIAPHHDLLAVSRLRRLLTELSPDIVHAHTPKAGLLGMVASATLSRRPVRIYHLHGLRFETLAGWRRQLLRTAETLTCHLADRVLCVSPSLRQKAEREGIVRPGVAEVLCHGSVNGIDLQQFPDAITRVQQRTSTREELQIPKDAICLGFVGRLVRDKGICELADAWQRLRQRHRSLHLLIVGPYEAEDPVPHAVREALHHDPRVHLVGADWNPIRYYAAMDLFLLPTHREGLGNVLLEAAAMELPIVSCRVTGVVDAVAENQTAKLVPASNAGELERAIESYLESPDERRGHGEAGRRWVEQRFLPQAIWQATEAEYRALLETRTSVHESFSPSPESIQVG